MFKEDIQKKIEEAIIRLQQTNRWPAFDIPFIEVNLNQEDKFGDYASTIAFSLAMQLKKSPLEIANDLATELVHNFTKVEVAPQGFLNFFLKPEQFIIGVKKIIQKKEKFGFSNLGKGKKILLEFISANPTGPLTLPNARGGFLGDVLANVYGNCGYKVMREYYVNDRGGQIDILGESVARRYLQKQGINVPYDETLYQGEYIGEIASKLEIKDYTLNNSKKLAWVKERITKQALALMLKDIQRVVKEKMKITFDNWFSEKKLYEDGFVDKAYKLLKQNGYVYEKEGAMWLATSKFGDEKDRVIIKSNGEGSYLQGDAALFYERAFKRKFNKVIIIIGADHHGFEKRMKALPKMFQTQTELDLIFIQLVTLMREGKEVRMSKRAGNFVTIDELIEEVGHDVARFFFLMSSSDRHMQFDLAVAKEQSEKNPVYYVQYAHARICSILREIETGQYSRGGQSAEYGHPAEKNLIKQLAAFNDMSEEIVKSYEVQRLPHYALDLARAFHNFYDSCRVIEDKVVNSSRQALVVATKIVLGNVLRLLAITAPEKM